ncbi:UDP-glucose dehydrogenase family protein [Aliibacillus thermotolerans]|uniref:UDP-glucose 6-dehydrogenase n=2 Tax=Bacillati TaxID=1783272 RepID=A0ABW0U6S7_9BACI|nr:UDP-glucose/GDP-mannose dehydrogenase family protein [Aliibacillus thermotolerans]MDA3130933.1 nucleotide sugar dehydrogenase [Aliibacillus thermotolerans]
MKLAVIGTGYVGLVSGTGFSELGNDVICVDKIKEKIEQLNNNQIPIYEPGLEELVRKNREAGRLSFTTDLKAAVKASDLVFIAVGTPESPSGAADLSYVYGVAEEIGEALDHKYKVIVVKSTVPVGTSEEVERRILMKNPDANIDVCSVPEFLREGSAVHDTFHPDRIVIGARTEKAANLLVELHSPLTDKIITTDPRSSEMIKYASNAFLATKISFINEMANICDAYEADIQAVAKGMGLDHRIGPKFLNAGIGYGGSCFPKDVKALKHLAEEKNYHSKILQAVINVNDKQSDRMIEHFDDIFGDKVEGLTVGMLGLAFKPNTDDMREAPSLKIIPKLLERGVHVKAYDPIARDNAQSLLPQEVKIVGSLTEAIQDVDALFLVTEWEEFLSLSPAELKALMKQQVVIDGRNAFDRDALKQEGFIYRGIGRK